MGGGSKELNHGGRGITEGEENKEGGTVQYLTNEGFGTRRMDGAETRDEREGNGRGRLGGKEYDMRGGYREDPGRGRTEE